MIFCGRRDFSSLSSCRLPSLLVTLIVTLVIRPFLSIPLHNPLWLAAVGREITGDRLHRLHLHSAIATDRETATSPRQTALAAFPTTGLMTAATATVRVEIPGTTAAAMSLLRLAPATTAIPSTTRVGCRKATSRFDRNSRRRVSQLETPVVIETRIAPTVQTVRIGTTDATDATVLKDS
jgi:hypothetical protein